MKVKDIIGIVLIAVLSIAFLATVYSILFGQVHNENLVHLLMVEILAMLLIPINYRWGSSQGRNDQSEEVEN